MTNDFLELIVKVGKKSTLNFSHAKAYRAISSVDLVNKSKNHSNCQLVIIENIREEELNDVKDFIISFTKRGVDNKVWFYVKDNDDITCGLADELEYEIFMSEDKLFRDIFNKTGLLITSDIKLRKELSNWNDDTEYDPFAAFENGENNNSNRVDVYIDNGVNVRNEVEEEIKITLEKQNEQAESFKKAVEEAKTTLPEEVVEIPVVKPVITEKPVKKPSLTLDKKEEKPSSNDESNKAKGSYINQAEFDKLKSELEDARTELEDTKVELNETKEELGNIGTKYSDLSTKYKELNTKHIDLTEYANNRISELNKLNSVLKNKYNDILEQYNLFIESDLILEDPISLEEYRNLGIELEDTRQSLTEATVKVKELTESNNESSRIIEQLEEEVKTYSEKLEKRKEEITALNETIELGAGKNEEIERLTEKLAESENKLEKARSDAARNIEITNEEIKKLKNKIGSVSEKYEAEAYARRVLAEFTDSLVIKYTDAVRTIENLNVEIENQNTTIEGLRGDSDNIIVSQGNDIKNLRQQIEELEGQKQELTTQLNESSEMIEDVKANYETQINMLREQVQFAESKYARLEQAAYVSDATQLSEQNKALEDINISLRNQLRVKNEDLERGVRERAELTATIRKLDEEKTRLKNSMKTMTNGIQGGISQKIAIPKINYNGKNFIIPVFGSGSYGITTTAMSLAYKFAERASTLYIDFDLVSPKCDIWFKRSPLCTIPNSIDNGKDYSTSLGLMFERGTRYFLDNYGHIVFNRLKTKNGTLDYLTGVYAKFETYKYMSADFSTLLTSLGNTYQYVIIDMGRLGGSELTDSIIAGITKAVCERGNRCVAVTTSNNIEIRNLRNKITEVGIDISSVAWLVNMARSSKIDDKALKYIRPALAGTMPFDPDLYGFTQTFQEENRSRNKALEQFIGNCIYASR